MSEDPTLDDDKTTNKARFNDDVPSDGTFSIDKILYMNTNNSKLFDPKTSVSHRKPTTILDMRTPKLVSYLDSRNQNI